MAETLTAQQQQAVSDRGGKLLVSAAAGSGKTKVLVDRLLSYLLDPYQPANLDDFLIITYTKAAAAELRTKIANKLSEKISTDPENRHLQHQLQRLYLTKISTVHSFCADILREYAYYLDIPSDFRVADETECLELQIRVMDQVLTAAYAKIADNPDFCAFIDTQGLGRDDRQIPEIVLKVYNSAKCHLNPEQWLDNCVAFEDAGEAADVAQTMWGRYLIDDLRSYLDLHIDALNRCALLAANADNMEKPAQVLSETVDQLRLLRNAGTWDAILAHSLIDYGTLRFSAKCTDTALIQQIKAVREACKKGVAKKMRAFSDNSTQILSDNRKIKCAVRGLVSLVKQFDTAYSKLKQSRRMLDFSDLEHKMLDLVLGKSRNGITVAATEIGKRFREVMVDEYQDTNQVQDAIFAALTQRKQNCFMVGDVKQSIYQFRLADPGIFLEKYNAYPSADNAAVGEGRKVVLSSNFRSSGGVIQAVNDVFSICMSEQVGGLVYGEEEQLNEGLEHIPLGCPETELYCIDVEEDTYAEEASFVADHIAGMLDGKHMVRDKNGLRSVKPEDIVILLRSPNSVGGQFQFALEQRGIRCDMGGGADLLSTEEVETLVALLRVICNPLQDIPLVALLGSRLFGFTADDLAVLRQKNKHISMYESLLENPLEKTKQFLDTLNKLRRVSQMSSLSNLLTRIFSQTRIDSIYAALPNGELRVENLQNFMQIVANYERTTGRGLVQFLEYLDAISDRGISASGEQSTSGAVTIMSIHKSKGLEFPVVFLCGLSRAFNRESTRAQVLCDKQLGLGPSCADEIHRVRYPSVAKRAIAAKITAESLSEEMRVLYVAMTRAKDRLIMTYAAPNVENDIQEISVRMAFSDPLLLTVDADCPGVWVLLTALKCSDRDWKIQRVKAPENNAASQDIVEGNAEVSSGMVAEIQRSLHFSYGHIPATQSPSKQTATQLKGRRKDQEIAENTRNEMRSNRSWRKPSFVEQIRQGSAYGNAYHAVMQYISYDHCMTPKDVSDEIHRLVEQQFISQEQADMVDSKKIADFFATDVGQKLCTGGNVLREFKFSVLQDAVDYYPEILDEKILVQGVVDCALIEDDGITVIDFKTDRVTTDTIESVAASYRQQLLTYAHALEKIYKKPIKAAMLYFFSLGQFFNTI